MLYDKLEFAIANKDAKKLIEESTIVVFPDRSPVNIAKCYLEIEERYKRAINIIRLFTLLVPDEKYEPHAERVVDDAHLLLKEDFDLAVINNLGA